MNLQDLAQSAIQQYRTTPALVADVLREAILHGLLKAGQPLRQDELAAQFGLSRSPVREALRQLEGEGLVTSYPHRGAVVSEFSAAEMQELCEIRVPLETTAMRLALPHLTDEVIERAAAIIEAADRMTDAEARTQWGANNWEFHSTLYAPAQRPRLFALIKNLHTHFDRYVRMYFALVPAKERLQHEHRAILDACRRHDAEQAVTLVASDIGDIGDMLSVVLQHQGRLQHSPS